MKDEVAFGLRPLVFVLWCLLLLMLSTKIEDQRPKTEGRRTKATSSVISLTPLVWRVSVAATLRLLFSNCVWVPQLIGENREAGEIPARSRHCEEFALSQETCPDTCRLSTLAQRCSGSLWVPILNPAEACFPFVGTSEVSGFRVF
jgi:hypothetical protein